MISDTWVNGMTAEDTAELFAATDKNKNTGTGAYFLALDLDSATKDGQRITAVKDEKYTVKFFKQSHLGTSLEITASSENFSEAAGLPAGDETLYLPAGDIGDASSKGNGFIGYEDRAAIMLFLAHGGDTSSPLFELADIDGNGKVTIADLSILQSPNNFLKRSAYVQTIL